MSVIEEVIPSVKNLPISSVSYQNFEFMSGFFCLCLKKRGLLFICKNLYDLASHHPFGPLTPLST